ncbi:hypothetical protein LZ554_005345 [Drepanopeziza brunnea f. sp. 'monogermtubi']|nr:hypothetical protein LZ554_005345 [Drepanopeziza brunnea f. sp. 'monogermtubi']
MASQAAIFAETIAGMKKAIKRKAYDSDSENEIENLTNRGNKLRKKARYVHEGQLAAPSGPQVYRRSIEHAGYQRDIIFRNHPLIDEDGYEVDSDEDDERSQTAIAAAAEKDPYSDIKVENLLVPLTAASDLPHHPTLSKPFTSKTLTELTRAAGEMVQKEKASLWKIKHLLTKLSGDNTWYPCASVETDNDFALFLDERERVHGNMLEKEIPRVEADQVSTGTLASEEVEHPEGMQVIDDKSREGSQEGPIQTIENGADGDVVVGSSAHSNGINSGRATGAPGPVERNGEAHMGAAMEEVKISKEAPNGHQVLPEDTEMPDGEPEGDHEGVPPPRRMRTRAQAQAASDNNTIRTRSVTPNSGQEMFIHPYFLAPAFSRPDRNVGLPPPEADETRRLLQLYIQKQEEICRGAQKIYDGLLRADRYRKLVFKWAKAEGHVGANRDMSDGEDWYDKDEWGLVEDLKKGQDEEEEDAATTAKKTRTRRQ